MFPRGHENNGTSRRQRGRGAEVQLQVCPVEADLPLAVANIQHSTIVHEGTGQICWPAKPRPGSGELYHSDLEGPEHWVAKRPEITVDGPRDEFPPFKERGRRSRGRQILQATHRLIADVEASDMISDLT
jgi:hypothetical protein